MALTPHRCAVSGPGPSHITCVCTTGQDHGEEEMDLPGGQLAAFREQAAAEVAES